MRKEDLSARKIVWYIVIGFFSLIIIISFGMPDFLSRIGGNQNMVAIVNGVVIDRMDYVRFRDNMAQGLTDKSMSDKEASRAILNALVEHKLQIQKAKKLHISVSDQRVRNVIKGIPIFKNSLGSFDSERYKRYLSHYNFGMSEYFFYVRENLLSGEFYNMIESGIGVSPDEIIAVSAIENSIIQVQYAFVSNWELKKIFREQIAVSDAEISAELKKHPEERKSKEKETQARASLEERKFQNVRGRIIGEIENAARARKPFAEMAKKLGIVPKLSRVFKVGENFRDDKGADKYLAHLTSVGVFIEDALMIEPGNIARPVPTVDGVIVFSPVKKEISFEEPDAENYSRIEKKLLKERMNSVYASMMGSFRNQSRITVNPGFLEK